MNNKKTPQHSTPGILDKPAQQTVMRTQKEQVTPVNLHLFFVAADLFSVQFFFEFCRYILCCVFGFVHIVRHFISI